MLTDVRADLVATQSALRRVARTAPNRVKARVLAAVENVDAALRMYDAWAWASAAEQQPPADLRSKAQPLAEDVPLPFALRRNDL